MSLVQLIEAAIREDLPNGDLTTLSLGQKERKGEAHLVAKEDLIFSGKECFEKTMSRLEPNVEIQWNFADGDMVLAKQVVAVIRGNLLQILQAERIALNFVGHLSGVATLTACFAKKVEGTETKILDTRKTLPGYRELEKKAVVHGGGFNHRMNLSDAVLIKENHIQVAGSIKNAVERIRRETKKDIEVEVKDLEEVKMAVELGVQRILLDNMDNETTAKALKLIPNTIETEASGNMTLDRVRGVAELGVNYISIGALTHSAPCADLSLLFIWEN